MKHLFIAFIFCINAIAHSLPPETLKINEDGQTSDKNIKVLLWDQYGGESLGDLRILFITAPADYLIGGDFELKKDTSSVELNSPMFFSQGDAYFKNRKLFKMQVHKDSLSKLVFTLLKKTEHDHTSILLIKGSSLIEIKKNQRV